MYTTSFGAQISKSEIDYMRNQGQTNKEIAENLGVSAATISKYYPIENRRKRRKLTNQEKMEIITLFRNGKKAPQIAEDYDIARQTVYDILRKAGVNVGDIRKERKQTAKTETETRKFNRPEPKEREPQPEQEGEFGTWEKYNVLIYTGYLGNYQINHKKDGTDGTVIIPLNGGEMNKEKLGHYIRDLMAIYREV